MTKDEALAIVLDIANRWGENAEEAFPRRLTAEMADEQIMMMLLNRPGEYDESDIEQAIEVRDLWRAIAVLRP